MNRFSIKDMLNMPQYEPSAVYKDQLAVIDATLFGVKTARELFAINAFAIGYVLSGNSIYEFNHDR